MTGDLFDIFNGASPLAPFVVIEVPGPPRGKQAHESRWIKVKVPRLIKGKLRHGFLQNYTPKETELYQEQVAKLARHAMVGKQMIPAGAQFWMRLYIILPVPPSWPKRDRDAALTGALAATEKPDDDNVSKALDALNGIVWADDKQRTRSLIVKEYGERPGLIIEVYRPV